MESTKRLEGNQLILNQHKKPLFENNPLQRLINIDKEEKGLG